MDDWDKRVEKAAPAFVDRVIAQAEAFTAGANWAREEMSKDNFLAMMSTGLYEAENEIEALRKQCEAMAEALEFECGKRCAEGINPCNAREALDAYQKFKEGAND